MTHSLRRRLPLLLAVAGIWLLASDDARAHYPLFDLPGPIVEPKQPFDLDMSYGHFFLGDRYPAKRPEWVGVAAVGGRARDYTAAVTSTTDVVPRWRLHYTPRKPGDYVIGWHAGMFHEPPERRILDFCKVVLHARTPGGTQTGWDRALGSPMEILPLTRPYAIPVGSVFRGRLVRHVKPENGDRLRAEPMPDMVVEAEARSRPLPRRAAYLPNFRLSVKTDSDGEFAVTLPQKGWWMIAAATDGGPGQQGQSKILQRRAVLLVHVGETVWDTPDPEPELAEQLSQGEHDFSFTGTLRDCFAQLSSELGVVIQSREIELTRSVRIEHAKGTAAQVCDAVAFALGVAWRRADGAVVFYKA